MKLHQYQFSISTNGRDTYPLTNNIERMITKSGIKTGLCHVFIHHTSASLIITENADLDVRRDLETIFSRLAPDGDADYLHTLEGVDDMSAHIRSVLTQTELTLPISRYHSGLGAWQGIFLWEHRTGHFQRQITVTLTGEE
ncbi:MAG: secondary thiamine-phosphate synthase enzyme YjbQ [Cocleimonas sp.]|nr:secondary thiamine-phosphate synthase enzyme YjbQ [Cocleimonas sp.]